MTAAFAASTPAENGDNNRITTLYSILQMLPSLFDTREVICDENDDPVPLPLHYVLDQAYSERDVFEVDRPVEHPRPTGCLWTLSSTICNQQLLTVWDTGAVIAVVPRSTITLTGTPWIESSDIDFVMADGVCHSPLGHAPRFVFRIASLYFVLRVYVVEQANYQLLLGTGFMHEVGAALFPKWRKVVLTSPERISLTASTDAIERGSCPPLSDESESASIEVHKVEKELLRARQMRAASTGSKSPESTDSEVIELLNAVEMQDPIRVMFIESTTPAYALCLVLTINTDVNSTYRLGMKDFIRDIENEQVESVDSSMPVLTHGFVLSNIEFGPEVPDPMKRLVCKDIIDYSYVFSWNAFDLGYIVVVFYPCLFYILLYAADLYIPDCGRKAGPDVCTQSGDMRHGTPS